MSKCIAKSMNSMRAKSLNLCVSCSHALPKVILDLSVYSFDQILFPLCVLRSNPLCVPSVFSEL